jgi:alanine racemase
MHRNGIEVDQIPQAMELIKQKELILNGAFTHFCCAEENNTILQTQEDLFLEAVETIKTLIKTPFRIHCANSAATHKVDMNLYDIARVGLGIYGYLDLPQESKLKPVLSLHAQKISTKKIQQGDHVGYGSESFVAKKDMTVSNYDIGYGDGLFRANSHKERKIANGKEILGRVSMDSFSVESELEEVCVFDDANHFAQVHNTITYEILTSLKPNIKRIVI